MTAHIVYPDGTRSKTIGACRIEQSIFSPHGIDVSTFWLLSMDPDDDMLLGCVADALRAMDGTIEPDEVMAPSFIGALLSYCGWASTRRMEDDESRATLVTVHAHVSSIVEDEFPLAVIFDSTQEGLSILYGSIEPWHPTMFIERFANGGEET